MKRLVPSFESSPLHLVYYYRRRRIDSLRKNGVLGEKIVNKDNGGKMGIGFIRLGRSFFIRVNRYKRKYGGGKGKVFSAFEHLLDLR
ncbi:MAG: hypothetical protein AB1656_10750 [Candidatus Omnitrophota bacterium]